MNYDFRQELLTVHKSNIRNVSYVPADNEITLPDNLTISLTSSGISVAANAIMDFIDFLDVSMNITASLSDISPFVRISLASDSEFDLKSADSYRGFAIETTASGINIHGYDECGIAQALYYIEDLMSISKAPVMTLGTVYKAPVFSPQMVHSGYEEDIYPDEYLNRIAHEGRDAILVFVTGINETPTGHVDFNDLIKRAARFGIDVYAYSMLKISMHPDDDGAYEHYDSVYGELFRACPGFKGITLVGESVEFPSKDPHVSPICGTVLDTYGLPSGKPRAGWYPCEDYPKWLDLVKKVIRKHNSEADIVFWTYNWGRLDKDIRIKLIKNLPTDISLMATFEMFEEYNLNGVRERIADYSLKFEGPGKYFTSEAKIASDRGIKLYAMTNTGGLTWDFGVIPYEPMPYQWMLRYKAMKKAHDDWGLTGIMESHHYGFYPSIISKFSKWVFNDFDTDSEEHLYRIIQGMYGYHCADDVLKAFYLFSEAIKHYTPTDNDQYGPFRIGPAYPLSFLVPFKNPSQEGAYWGNKIYQVFYNTWKSHEVMFDKGSPLSVRIKSEIQSLEKMLSFMKKGIEIIKNIDDKNTELLRLINLSEYIYHCIVTGINAKKWYLLTARYNLAETHSESLNILNDMEMLLNEEIQNSEDTIPLVEYDSRLGWEPSMEYMGNSERIKWKIKHAHYVINSEIASQKKSIKL